LKGKQYLEKLLAVPIKTFIFPWNTFDQLCLETVKKSGFKNVLVGWDNFCQSQGLNIISKCHEDLWNFAELLKEIKNENRSQLVHLLYHSWMIKDEEISKLESLLRELSDDNDICFVTVQQLEELGVSLDTTLRLSDLAYRLNKRANDYLKNKIPVAASYVLSPLTYIKEIIRSGSLILFNKIAAR